MMEVPGGVNAAASTSTGAGAGTNAAASTSAGAQGSAALMRLPQFTDKAASFKHYAKHSKGIILGKNGKVTLKKGGTNAPMFRTLDEYVSGAQQFFNRTGSNILTKTRANGEVLRFDINTGFFGAKGSNGNIKTFFRPKNGVDYFLQQ